MSPSSTTGSLVRRPPTEDTLSVSGLRPFRGELTVPGDKSISLRVLLLGSMAQGTSILSNLSTGHDTQSMLSALGRLGAGIEGEGSTIAIKGGTVASSAQTVNLGASPTSLRLMAGMLAGQPAPTTMVLSEMSEVKLDALGETLERIGAHVVVSRPSGRPAISVTGGSLRGGDVSPSQVSAQLKSALLLAGIQLEKGYLRVSETRPTRNHTEELLKVFGGDIEIEDELTTVVRPSKLSSKNFEVPGDPSHAAYWLFGAAIIPGSSVTVRNIHTGERRAGYLKTLHQMGAHVSVAAESGSVTVNHGPDLKPLHLNVDEIPAILDEIPIICLAAATAAGTTTISGVKSVRAGAPNRVAAALSLLTKFGVEVSGDENSFSITGKPQSLVSPEVVSWEGDHHLGFTAAIAAASSPGHTAIRTWSRAQPAYPEFAQHMEGLAS